MLHVRAHHLQSYGVVFCVLLCAVVLDSVIVVIVAGRWSCDVIASFIVYNYCCWCKLMSVHYIVTSESCVVLRWTSLGASAVFV